jgi:hypothetical protein
MVFFIFDLLRKSLANPTLLLGVFGAVHANLLIGYFAQRLNWIGNFA